MKYCLAIIFFLSALFANGQMFTHADTLRGTNGAGRNWWDAVHYDLNIRFDIADSSISGYNAIDFRVIDKSQGCFQIDLQKPLVIDSVIYTAYRANSSDKGAVPIVPHSKKLPFRKEGNAWFINLDKKDVKFLNGMKSNYLAGTLIVYYHGKPRVAVNPPWDGGIVWSHDNENAPFIGVACQGLGASVWYPNKDWQGDEPNGATMTFTAPDTLDIISNGKKLSEKNNGDGTHAVTWQVLDPINNYDISPYIGKYAHWHEVYEGLDGPLDMDYFVLKDNVEKAKNQFKQAPMMIKAFEYWFGPYPFYKDGYKLVQAPYLGMEHQSAVGYGNKFENGYLGRDLSGTGWGLKWDFIIIHESGHEWFGNNITTKDIADMWVHEGFTNYSEALYTEYYFGKEAGKEYVVGVRKNIRNDKPVIGKYGVNNEGSGDMYYKAGNMIHMIRQIINDDEKFRDILHGLNRDFRHQTVTGNQIRDYINEKAKLDFNPVFDQYLETTQIPVLAYQLKEGGKLLYKWTNCIEGFNMPVRIYNDQNELIWIFPTDTFQAVNGISFFKIDDNFYVNTQRVDNF